MAQALVFLDSVASAAQDVNEVGYALGGGFLDDGHPVGNGGGPGVDIVDGHTALHILDEGGGGIDHQRRADDDKDVGVMRQLCCGFHVGYRLAKEHDVGPDVVAKWVQGVHARFHALRPAHRGGLQR